MTELETRPTQTAFFYVRCGSSLQTSSPRKSGVNSCQTAISADAFRHRRRRQGSALVKQGVDCGFDLVFEISCPFVEFLRAHEPRIVFRVEAAGNERKVAINGESGDVSHEPVAVFERRQARRSRGAVAFRPVVYFGCQIGKNATVSG